MCVSDANGADESWLCKCRLCYSLCGFWEVRIVLTVIAGWMKCYCDIIIILYFKDIVKQQTDLQIFKSVDLKFIQTDKST